MLARVALVAFAAFSVIAYAGNAEGSHPFQGSGQLNINYLHADFEAFGDGRIFYRLCDNAQRGVPAEWQNGVERWDSLLGTAFEFDPVISCSDAKTGATKLRWEVGAECPSGALACWNTWKYSDHYAPHGSHNDILLGLIIFDPAKWDQVPNWRAYMPAHEFGHDLSLADHVSHNCAENTVMLNYTAGYFPPNPCGSDPTIADLTSVTCNVYSGAGGGPWTAWEDLGGIVLNSAPAVAAWDCNRLDVFALGPGNYVWHKWYDGVWHDWENMWLVGTSAPAVASWAPGRLDVFVRGTDGALWHLWFYGSWSQQWDNLGGSAGGSVAAASWGPERIDLFDRPTATLSLYHKWWASGWSGWVQEDPAFIGSTPAVTSWGLLRLDVFARGLNGTLWHKSY